MKLEVTDRKGVLSPGLQMLAEKRMQFALGRFESRIRSLELVVSDVNGPRGGVDKVCRVMVGLRGVPMIVVNDRDADLAKCLSRLADRVARTVTKEVDRLQQVERHQPLAFELPFETPLRSTG